MKQLTHPGNHFQISDMRNGYRLVVANVAARGEPVSPRGQDTLELQGATIKLTHPLDSIPSGVGRRPNVAIGAAEALQLIGGFSDPELMVAITKNFERYKDAGVLHGAYGSRVRPQLPQVVNRLKRDPDTRQAVLNIWDPLHDLHVPDSADYPCTLSLQFLLRNGRLVLHTHMRSNDVWMGLPYDVFQFTQLQLTVANLLGVPVGSYWHHANSLHIYKRDLDRAVEMKPACEASRGTLAPHGLDAGTLRGTGSMQTVMERARMIAEGVLPDSATPAEKWYFSVLRSAVARKKTS